MRLSGLGSPSASDIHGEAAGVAADDQLRVRGLQARQESLLGVEQLRGWSRPRRCIPRRPRPCRWSPCPRCGPSPARRSRWMRSKSMNCWTFCLSWPRARVSGSSRRATRRTSNPFWAKVCAMPSPIVPVPTISIFSGCAILLSRASARSRIVHEFVYEVCQAIPGHRESQYPRRLPNRHVTRSRRQGTAV